MTGQQLARQSAREHRVIGAVTASGVRQDRVLVRRHHIQQIRLTGVLADVRAADGHRDDLRATCGDRAAGLFQILVFAGANEQPRVIGDACDDQRVGLAHRCAVPGNVFSARTHYPPPIARTISTRSSGCNWYS